MEAKKVCCPLPLCGASQTLLDDHLKATVLTEHYTGKIGTKPILHPPQDLCHVVEAATTSSGPRKLALPFKTVDLSGTDLPDIRKSCRSRSYPLLIPPTIRTDLLQIYNTSWLTGDFPSCWKSSVPFLIAKPGKNPTLPLAYRLMALLSCIGKLMEWLVTTQMPWWMENSHLLREAQCGFHPCCSTLHILTQIKYHTCNSYHPQQTTMSALFLDLEGAFDTTSHEGVLYKLAHMGITGTPPARVKSFLSGRFSQVSVGASMSASLPIQRGIPQCSILSPLLFNVLLSNLHVPCHSHLLIVSRAVIQSESQRRQQLRTG
ncbi:RNA-directed DNA polymerase from mobile element jockey [Portunus trituberculatus]|uniref:RNA-directed DNA polymerase from mobile element jockey n=1 Tax=Portunus trituberculatus TaxID=210409 RepID=A0A5B7FUQ7_PORTR|nr:RNA-directed DNA polymerase from mobile element jockey [Portunus trituberculatus]